MAQIKIKVPGFGDSDADSPIVILGPNGSGKTQLARKITEENHDQVSAVSAQRRTWIDDHLPVQEEKQLLSSVRQNIDRWRTHSWQPTEEINHLLSTLVQEHSSLLSKRNDEAIAAGGTLDPVTDTKLIRLQTIWGRLFPKRMLDISGFFPRVKRLDAEGTPSYHLREMSDGERTVLYMAARVLTTSQPVILVDEPELHMHSRLAVRFWDEAEKLRPDCRFVYITHDLNFALSRRKAVFLIARSDGTTEIVLEELLPTSVAAEVLGAATLPFYAKRIFFFEGEAGQGFASEFFLAWFDDDETFAIPAGNRSSVCAAVSGLKTVGVVAAEIIGLIDRDFYSDEVLGAVTAGVTVLPLHEIESVLCDKAVVTALAEHLGKNPAAIWTEFLEKVRNAYRGKAFNAIVARRVRARVGDLLDNAFTGDQISEDFNQTVANHRQTMTDLNLPAKIEAMFAEENTRVARALVNGDAEMLAVLPGKHLLSLLASTMGLNHSTELSGLVTKSLNRKHLKARDALLTLSAKLEAPLLAYLPSRIA